MSPIQSSGAASGTAGAEGGALETPAAHRKDYLPALEGIRGMAVLLVVLSHMSSTGVVFDESVNFRGLGNYGVYLFFVLSAFLLTRQFLERPPEPATAGGYWGAYAMRRILRIYPLYTVVLLSTAVAPLISFAVAGPRPPSILRHLLLLDGQKIFWTIPVEMKFYMLLPALLIATHVLAHSKPLASVVFLTLFLFFASWAVPAQAVPRLSIDLPDYLAVFLFGMIAAALWQWISRRSLPGPVRWVCDLLGIFFLLAVLGPQFLGAPFGPSHALFAYWLGSTVSWYGAAWSLFLLSVLAGRFLAEVFKLRVIRVVGLASFSAYLWHMPIIIYLKQVLPPAPWAAAVILAAVVIISIVSYRALELPGIELSARWSRRKLDAA